MKEPCWEHTKWEEKPIEWLDGKLLMGVRKISVGIEFRANGQPCRLHTGGHTEQLIVEVPSRTCTHD